jgi:hypothetical protein
MRKGVVAVLYIHPLFGRGIAQLLQSDDLNVTCLQADAAFNPDEVKRLRPHAIVAECSGDDAFIRDLLPKLPSVLLIEVRLEDNVMDVHYRRQVPSASPEDLLEAIHRGMSRESELLAAS